MTIKKVIIILSAILLMSGLVYVGWFWFVVLSDPQGPEFTAVQGKLVAPLTVEKDGKYVQYYLDDKTTVSK